MRWLVALVMCAAACSASDSKPGPSDNDDTPSDAAAATVDATDPLQLTCESVPAGGTCASPTEVSRCVDGVVQIETCSVGCVELDGGAVCASAEVCTAIGPLGRCDGDVLWRCDGVPAMTSCAASGQVCAYRDDAIGYGCVDASSVGTYRVSGTIRWEDRPLSPGMLGAPVAKPVRGGMVAVLNDATDAVLAQVSAADDGTYVAHYNAPASGMVRIAMYSRSLATARPARVRNASGYLYAIGSTPFAAGAQSSVDLIVTASSASGGAWNALDNAVSAMDWLRASGIATLGPVYMYWQKGSATGSYYSASSNVLHLDGDDGFDDVVALHELGHYMQDEHSPTDNPGGPHSGSTPSDPRLAWAEGSASWFAIAVRGVPYYIDYSADGGWYVALEDDAHLASLSGAMSQNIKEWMVAELMWDLGDDATGDADPVDGTPRQVWDVVVGYLASSHVDRGRAGMDLVEFLDGWFAHHGTAWCAAMRMLVRDKYLFPYDFAGPAGTCP